MNNHFSIACAQAPPLKLRGRSPPGGPSPLGKGVLRKQISSPGTAPPGNHLMSTYARIPCSRAGPQLTPPNSGAPSTRSIFGLPCRGNKSISINDQHFLERFPIEGKQSVRIARIRNPLGTLKGANPILLALGGRRPSDTRKSRKITSCH